ncbi:MAG: phosphotransferase [Anaerolineales bacterium]
MTASCQPEFLQWAALAIEHYPLARPRLEFIRHSENLTFRVSDGRRQYLLRLHQPKTPTLADLRQQPQAILSELQWMAALRSEAGIPVPPVVPNRNGELVTLILPEGQSDPIPCSLLGWVNGRPFEPAAEDAPALARRLGELMARMHAHAAAWQPPEGFLRPRYGSDHAWALLEKLSAGVSLGILSPADFALLRALADALTATISEIAQTPEHYGLIHGDLHTGNWLTRRGRIIPLDFSLCAFGYYLFDIAIAAGSLGTENAGLRPFFFEGYRRRRPLPEDRLRAIEAFFILSVLGHYTFILPDASRHEWLYENIPRMLRTIGQNFLRQEPFFLETD